MEGWGWRGGGVKGEVFVGRAGFLGGVDIHGEGEVLGQGVDGLDIVNWE